MAGYEEWTPRPATVVIVREIQRILEKDFADILPVTARQIFYRLVASGHVQKDADASFYRTLTKARRAEMVSFEDISDSGQTLAHLYPNTGPAAVVERAQRILNGAHYQLDRQAGQWRRVVLWCEAAGMVPQLERVARPYGVEVISGGGQPSITFCYQAAQRIADQCYAGENQDGALVLQLGDHDPGGLIIQSSAGADVWAFGETWSVDIEVRRLLVTMEQVRDLDLLGQVPKFDKRVPDWQGLAYQAEAIDPRDLAQIVKDALDAELDADTRDVQLAKERDDVATLRKQAKRLTTRPAGRPRTHGALLEEKARKLHGEGNSIRKIAKLLEVSRTAVGRWVKD